MPQERVGVLGKQAHASRAHVQQVTRIATGIGHAASGFERVAAGPVNGSLVSVTAKQRAEYRGACRAATDDRDVSHA